MHCWARYLFLLIVAVLGFGHMLGACGQKGPLYLPEQEPADETQTSAPVPTPLPGPDTSDEGLEALEDVPAVPPGPEVN
jgi:predicted small lipoprotein YifL